MRRMILVVGIVGAGLLAAPALANGSHWLNVDGQPATLVKVVGNDTVHYESTATNPTVAESERHTWQGNGSENLPCEYGTYWIDNKNVLTISHCLEGEPTVSTTIGTTTTTSTPERPTTTSTPEPTTIPTTVPPTTTPPTTVLGSTTTSTQANGPTTSAGPTTTETPIGGVQAGGGACADGACDTAIQWVAWAIVAYILGGVLLAVAVFALFWLAFVRHSRYNW